MSIKAMKATPHKQLIDELMDCRIPKTEREHAAAREIERLRQAIEEAEKQEPVAWELRAGKTDRVLIEITNNPQRAHDWKASLEEVVPLYTAPPQPEQEPVAWRTFDGEGNYEYRDYDMNENYAKEWAERNPNHAHWVQPLIVKE